MVFVCLLHEPRLLALRCHPIKLIKKLPHTSSVFFLLQCHPSSRAFSFNKKKHCFSLHVYAKHFVLFSLIYLQTFASRFSLQLSISRHVLLYVEGGRTGLGVRRCASPLPISSSLARPLPSSYSLLRLRAHRVSLSVVIQSQGTVKRRSHFAPWFAIFCLSTMPFHSLSPLSSSGSQERRTFTVR